MKNISMSFFGKTLRMYWLRWEYCALDRDIAVMFEVDKKALVALLKRKKYSDTNCFTLNINEYNRVMQATLKRLKKTDTVYALNELGIIRLSFDIRKSKTAAEVSVKVIRATAEVINLMAYVKKADDFNVPLGPQYDKVRKEIERAPDIVKQLFGL